MLVILGGLGGAGWYVTHTAPASAGVGDCLAQTGGNELAKVSCGDPVRPLRGAGQAENKTMVDASLDACEDVPKATSSYWEGKSGERRPGALPRARRARRRGQEVARQVAG